MSFEDYLISKKIDSQTFRLTEPEVWKAWKNDFEQIHPNSFTVQKLNLINLVRRKYLLPITPEKTSSDTTFPTPNPSPSTKPGKPVIKPKPKMN